MRDCVLTYLYLYHMHKKIPLNTNNDIPTPNDIHWYYQQQKATEKAYPIHLTIKIPCSWWFGKTIAIVSTGQAASTSASSTALSSFLKVTMILDYTRGTLCSIIYLLCNTVQQRHHKNLDAADGVSSFYDVSVSLLVSPSPLRAFQHENDPNKQTMKNDHYMNKHWYHG